ncbi:MAG: hypothetical protein PVJ39_11090 [Gammaproteobacteria bacterium]
MKYGTAVIVALLVMMFSVLLPGCYESTDATIYEPGVYKGETDPLLKKLRDKKFQAELEQRFKTGQTDR